MEFPIGRRVRLSNGPDIKLCKKERPEKKTQFNKFVSNDSPVPS